MIVGEKALPTGRGPSLEFGLKTSHDVRELGIGDVSVFAVNGHPMAFVEVLVGDSLAIGIQGSIYGEAIIRHSQKLLISHVSVQAGRVLMVVVSENDIDIDILMLHTIYGFNLEC